MPRTRTPKPLIPKPTAGFDINTRLMNETAVIQLVDPLNADCLLDAHITIAAPNSPEARAADEAFPFKFTTDGKPDMTPAEFEAVSTEHAIAVTKAWDLLDGTAPLPCTPETVRRVYTNPQTRWIGGQVRSKQLSLAGFFTTPKGNS